MRKFNSCINFICRNIPIHIIQLGTAILPNTGITTKIRGFLVRPFIKKCGSGFRLGSGVIINKPDRLIIGNDVYIAHNTWINAVGEITLEDKVIIGPMSVLASGKHVFENGCVTNKGKSQPIKIGKGSWLASHVVVTDGIEIGKGSIVAAGSVVTKDVSEESLVGGVPAKYIKKVLEN